MSVTVLHDDCLRALPLLPEASVDSVVTDPPYHLTAGKKGGTGEASVNLDSPYGRSRVTTGFMSKEWDGGDIAFRPETWAAVLRVLKPGGHLVAFGAPRNYHRLACAIEEAGFEIRDSILHLHATPAVFWVFGSGFPKSLNVSKSLDDVRCRCGAQVSANYSDMHGLRGGVDSPHPIPSSAEQDVLAGLRGAGGVSGADREGYGGAPDMPDLRDHDVPRPNPPPPERGSILQPELSSESTRCAPSPVRGEREGQEAPGDWPGGAAESGMERRGYLSSAEGELRQREVRPLPSGPDPDGPGGRLHDGASPDNGEASGAPAASNGSSASSGSRPTEQRRHQPASLAGQPEPQAGGAWPVCGGCGKPIIPDGLGTALKPAYEPIILARKPLIGTVAANVLAHGTGAINVDGCRVEAAAGDYNHPGNDRPERSKFGFGFAANNQRPPNALGRWPANIIHDGSDEVLDLFPESGPSRGVKPGSYSQGMTKGDVHDGWRRPAHENYGPKVGGYEDRGSNARFFYAAKASKAERAGSKHPTVKPLALMRWLVRLVTPPGGVVLDPFAGTGTTGQAALEEGFRAILIEREAEYQADIGRRLSAAPKLHQPDIFEGAA